MAGGGDGGRKAIIAAFLANSGIAIAKFVAFVFTRASSMLAEAIHSVADASNQLLLILGAARARRAPSPEHPFGYGRVRYFWAFIVAMVLFSMGGLFAIYEGVQKLVDPHDIESPAWAFAVLGLGIVFETLSLRTAVREAALVKGDRSWWGFVRRSKSPELPVVLLEDIGARVGLVLAWAGVGLAVATDNPRFDAVGSLAIGVLLVVIAVVLAVEMKSLLIGEAAAPRTLTAITRAIEDDPAVEQLIHMRTQHLGPDELLVAGKVEFGAGLTVPQLAEAINSLETRIREAVPIARVIYLEPDVYADGGERPPSQPV